jgi:D-beta-D-heptose 7-phosphate kinase / D-beta-D-heptose 1-phosphate adenosyltransferase
VSATAHIAVIGDALLDRDVEGTVDRLCPDAPVPVVDLLRERSRPGGAALAAVLAAADGHAVTLVTALGDDIAGAELRGLVAAHGVELVDLGLSAQTPEKLRVLTGGRSLIRIDRGERRPTAVGRAPRAALTAIDSADALLVADYGRGVAAAEDVRAGLERAGVVKPLVWDPHPEGPAPVPGAALATPNAVEAALFAPDPGGDDARGAAIGRARALRERWSARAVAVTLGSDGALLVSGSGPPLLVPAVAARGGDPCGAGDRFASRAVGSLATGASTGAAVEAAVAAASGFVDAGGAAAWARPSPAQARGAVLPRSLGGGPVELAEREHAAGRRVVATGGCFDLLHAGHVQMLQAARALGDTLVVCLNSDRSVAALKGEGRPLVSQAARAAVLEALACVDAVLVFDESTPERAIERLRPDVWVKGGDYAGEELPEARTVRAHGGEVVVLPQLRGYSTTRLIEEAVQRNAA